LSGTQCQDGLDCTVDDRCSATGDCVPGTADNNLCPQMPCAVGVCQPGGCILDPSLKALDLCRPANLPCDVAEVCDGSSNTCPVDGFQPPSFQCGAPSCELVVDDVDPTLTDTRQTDAVMCSGSSADCAAPNVTQCMGFVCDGGTPNQCSNTCAVDSDCVEQAYYCDTTSGLCEPRDTPGTACVDDSTCQQGDTCIDGVCCRGPCDGRCEACDIPGAEGVCTVVPRDDGAPHPGGPVGPTRAPCTSDPNGAACNGYCDGNDGSACFYPTTTESCGDPSCDAAANEATLEAFCNGAGTCLPPTTVSCGDYRCDGSACGTECADDSECQTDFFCAANVCVEKSPVSGTCTTDRECLLGNCVDGFCCDGACTGQCEACNIVGSFGICSPVQDGQPVGPREDCSGSGLCGGACDGENRTSCVFPAAEQRCDDAGCSGTLAREASYCDGSGQCAPGVETQCPGECDEELGLCADAMCQLDSQCDDGMICRSGICVDVGEPGDACGADNECGTGFCVDGVCCDNACGAQCAACNVPGSEGVCSPTPQGETPRGGRQACGGTLGGSCSGTCDGTTTESCSYPVDSCRDPACDANQATLAAFCDGAGNCPSVQLQACDPVACHATAPACDGTCATDEDACANSEYCSGGICLEKIADGIECAADSQCASGNCVDGVCCNTTCTDRCAACNNPDSLGTCSAVPAGPAYGFRAACEGTDTCGESCNGTDMTDCQVATTGTACGAEFCSLGVLTAAAQCDGAGRCSPGDEEACPSLACSSATECSDNCVDDTQCIEGFVCRDGSCILDPVIEAEDKGSCGCRVPGDPSGRRPLTPLAFLVPLLLLAFRARRFEKRIAKR